MRFVVIAHRNESAGADQFTPELMQAEAKTALGMWAEDFIRELYSRTDGKGAVLVIEAASEEEARERIGRLPLAEKGLLSFDIYGIKSYRVIDAMAAS